MAGSARRCQSAPVVRSAGHRCRRTARVRPGPRRRGAGSRPMRRGSPPCLTRLPRRPRLPRARRAPPRALRRSGSSSGCRSGRGSGTRAGLPARRRWKPRRCWSGRGERSPGVAARPAYARRRGSHGWRSQASWRESSSPSCRRAPRASVPRAQPACQSGRRSPPGGGDRNASMARRI